MLGWLADIARGERAGQRPSVDLESVLKAYRRYAPTYDVLFGRVFQWGRAATVAAVNELDCARVLEVGVGTGLSLPLYRPEKTLVGVDVSAEMLATARRRVQDQGLRNVEELAEMDGEHLRYADDSFDAVVAMYVMSVTPNPRRCLAEMQRVCKPGGAILVCNHFVREGEPSPAALIEPLSRWLGWRPDFALSDLLDNSRLDIIERKNVPPFGLFSVVVLRNA